MRSVYGSKQHEDCPGGASKGNLVQKVWGTCVNMSQVCLSHWETLLRSHVTKTGKKEQKGQNTITYEHQKHCISASFRPRYEVAFNVWTHKVLGAGGASVCCLLWPMLRDSIGLIGSFLMLPRGTAGIDCSWGKHLCSASCSLSYFGVATIETPIFTLQSNQVCAVPMAKLQQEEAFKTVGFSPWSGSDTCH